MVCAICAMLCCASGEIPLTGATGWCQFPSLNGSAYYSEFGTLGGWWDDETQEYRPFVYETRSWLPATEPPWSMSPRMGRRGLDGRIHYGVERPPGVQAAEGFTINSEATDREGALARLALAGVKPAGSAGRLFLIGPDQLTGPRAAELVAELARAGLADEWLVQAKPADHWWATQAGFKQLGECTLYALAADGRVLHAQGDWSGGAQAVVEALRRPRKDFDPSRLRDLRALGRFLPDLSAKNLRGLGIALTALCGAFFLRRRI